MLRRIPTFVKVQMFVLAVPALAISSSMEVQSIQRQHAAAARAEAVKVSHLASIQADRIIADERTTAELERTRESLATVTQERDQAQAKATDLEGQVESLKAQTAYRATSTGYGGGGSPQPAAGAGNHFVPGQCTWYVASRRNVPWFGNAGQWYGAAAAMGFAVGGTPRPGAIMVTWESRIGHVAYVESVNGSWWTVSEMNYVAPYIVDRRTLTYGRVPLAGFIY